MGSQAASAEVCSESHSKQDFAERGRARCKWSAQTTRLWLRGILEASARSYCVKTFEQQSAGFHAESSVRLHSLSNSPDRLPSQWITNGRRPIVEFAVENVRATQRLQRMKELRRLRQCDLLAITTLIQDAGIQCQ